MMNKKVMVGIMNWNQKEDTLRCLKSLRAAGDSFLTTVVVDNGSTDGSVLIMRNTFPQVQMIENKTNRGCAGGRNDLLDYFFKTDCDYLLFLDNDVTIIPELFQRLLEEINRSPAIGVVGVKAFYQDRPTVFWSRGGARFNPWYGRFEDLGQKEIDQGQYAQAEEVDSVPGGFTFLRRSVAEAVPKIDERYFIYYEDSDWCFKVRKAGFKLVTSEKACVYHKASSSLGMESPLFYYYRTRNRLLFMAENAGFYNLPFWIYFWTMSLPSTLLTLWLSKQYRQIRGIFLGIYDFFRGRWYGCSHPSIMVRYAE